MAPELVRRSEYDGRQVDMWALGVLLFALLSGTFPFRGQNEKELYGKIQRGQYKCPEGMSREARTIISKLIETDSRKRFKASDLIKENWINCQDLPLSVFESAGGLFRANSVDGRIRGSEGRSRSKADGFNRNITKIHV
jgi:serine/threonine protein kinase